MTEFKLEKVVRTWEAKIYMAGGLGQARAKLREICMSGLCVTLAPTEFVYTGGAEDGFVVGLINYPRFPSTEKALMAKAVEVAKALAAACCQLSFSIVLPDTTLYFTNGMKK